MDCEHLVKQLDLPNCGSAFNPSGVFWPKTKDQKKSFVSKQFKALDSQFDMVHSTSHGYRKESNYLKHWFHLIGPSSQISSSLQFFICIFFVLLLLVGGTLEQQVDLTS